MYKITKVEQLTETIYLMDVVAPRVANKCLPGQFVIVRGSEDGERIPLTICDYSREDGTITIVFQVVGAATEMMKNKKVGDSFADFVGPLGCPSEFCKEDIEELKKKKILFVAGGVGTAPVYPQVKWLHEQGIDADVIVGGHTVSFHPNGHFIEGRFFESEGRACVCVCALFGVVDHKHLISAVSGKFADGNPIFLFEFDDFFFFEGCDDFVIGFAFES